MNLMRRVITKTGKCVHLSENSNYLWGSADAAGHWDGWTLCANYLNEPAIIHVLGIDPYENDERPVDCRRCRAIAEFRIKRINRLLAGEW